MARYPSRWSIEIQWQPVRTDDDRQVLRIEWLEKGGPPVVEPSIAGSVPSSSKEVFPQSSAARPGFISRRKDCAASL
jgi:hypothetical protein